MFIGPMKLTQILTGPHKALVKTILSLVIFLFHLTKAYVMHRMQCFLFFCGQLLLEYFIFLQI